MAGARTSCPNRNKAAFFFYLSLEFWERNEMLRAFVKGSPMKFHCSTQHSSSGERGLHLHLADFTEIFQQKLAAILPATSQDRG